MNMIVEIIPATGNDAESLVSIQKQAFERLYELYHDYGSPYLRGIDEISQWLDRPNWKVYKILADGELCGGVAFCERNNMPGVYYLARIYILPKLQGNGIASKAILLCEATVMNANCWTLDFPADQIANRRCYEKAGYTDTGERREQSGGAITLAYMEKPIPAFRDIKNHLNNHNVLTLISYSQYEYSMERAAQKAISYYNDSNRQVYGWVENGVLLGICGFVLYSDKVVISNIAVEKDSRNKGIGRCMISAVKSMFGLLIEAETDDDAVDFYRKCGFETTSIYKQYKDKDKDKKCRRWICVLR